MSITSSRTREGGTMSADARSITEELREYTRNPFCCVTPNTTSTALSIADRIDARFTAELMAKQDEVDALRAKLDASILPPVDIDGARWTGEDVDKPFALTDGDKATEGLVREIVYDWPHEGWWIVDQYDTHYPADRCRHVAPEPTDSQECIDADAEAGTCTYFGHSCAPCDGCPALDGPASCHVLQILDLLRRQREIDGAGEQA